MEADPKVPSYIPTLIIAGLLYLSDGGGGYSWLFVVPIVVPILLLRAYRARGFPPLRNRRLASIPIYLAASFAALYMAQADRQAARGRAEQVIAACEAHRKFFDQYPESLEQLVPTHFPKVPLARERGFGPRNFLYFTAGPNRFTQSTNAHVLIYTVMPPIGRAYYVFEEKKWGFYD